MPPASRFPLRQVPWKNLLGCLMSSAAIWLNAAVSAKTGWGYGCRGTATRPSRP